MPTITGGAVQITSYGVSNGHMINASWRYLCNGSSTTDWTAAGTDFFSAFVPLVEPYWLLCAAGDYTLYGWRMSDWNGTFNVPAVQKIYTGKPGTFGGVSAFNGMGGTVQLKQRQTGGARYVTQTIYTPPIPQSEISQGEISSAYFGNLEALAAVLTFPVVGSLTSWELFGSSPSLINPHTILGVRASARLAVCRRRNLGT